MHRFTSKKNRMSQASYREYEQNLTKIIVSKLRKKLHKQYKLSPLFANSTFYIKDECPIKTIEIKKRLDTSNGKVGNNIKM